MPESISDMCVDSFERLWDKFLEEICVSVDIDVIVEYKLLTVVTVVDSSSVMEL